MDRPDFDVIVVGAGSAGCALVGRLCQATDLRVCLVEAGPDYGRVDGGQWPVELLDVRRRARTHDWGYVEERPDGRTAPVSRARVVGGCSAHNQCAARVARPSHCGPAGLCCARGPMGRRRSCCAPGSARRSMCKSSRFRCSSISREWGSICTTILGSACALPRAQRPTRRSRTTWPTQRRIYA
jgi:hypothetical protein